MRVDINANPWFGLMLRVRYLVSDSQQRYAAIDPNERETWHPGPTPCQALLFVFVHCTLTAVNVAVSSSVMEVSSVLESVFGAEAESFLSLLVG